MKTNDEIRRLNLEVAIRRAGSARKLADRAETSPAYISQIRNRAPDSKTGKPKMMGDDMARRFEKAIDEAPGWFDKEHSEAGTASIGGGSADTLTLEKDELRLLAIFRQAKLSHPTAKAVIDDALTVAQGLLDEAFFQQKQG